MTKHRHAAKTDANEADIVQELRARGYSVECGHDDLIVGRWGVTGWFEVKDPERCLRKDGKLKSGTLKPSQIRLLAEFKGHYSVVTSTAEIVEEMLTLRINGSKQ